MKNTINQLVLDCVAKVLRINLTTGAQICIEVNGHVNAVECDGYTRGYYNAEKEIIDGQECRKRDFSPLKDLPCGWIELGEENAEHDLHALLESLNALEKELIESGGVKAENMEANDEDHE